MIWKYVSPSHTRAKAAARPTWNFKEARKNCNGFLLSLVASRQLEGELELRDDVLNSKTEGAPLFKFGFNPSLIDGILNVLPYELASSTGYEKPKK